MAEYSVVSRELLPQRAFTRRLPLFANLHPERSVIKFPGFSPEGARMFLHRSALARQTAVCQVWKKRSDFRNYPWWAL
jgi:hypothetical protein